MQEEAFLHANDVAHQSSGQPEQHAVAAQKGDSNQRDSQSGSSSYPGTPERDENGNLSTIGTEDRWHSHKRPEKDTAIRGDGSVGPEITSTTNGDKAETSGAEPEWETVEIKKVTFCLTYCPGEIFSVLGTSTDMVENAA